MVADWVTKMSKDRAEIAHNEGMLAGEGNRNPIDENPYSRGTVENRRWKAGWLAGYRAGHQSIPLPRVITRAFTLPEAGPAAGPQRTGKG